MDSSATFTIARAKPSNADGIAEFVTQATRGRVSADAQTVLDRFGAKGLWLIHGADGVIVGLAGWRAENLIARIDDFLIYPFELYETAGKYLVERIEEAARELHCEVSMVMVPLRASPTLVDFYRSCGYDRAETEGIPRVWQETIQEATERGRYIMLHQLREDLITRPM